MKKLSKKDLLKAVGQNLKDHKELYVTEDGNSFKQTDAGKAYATAHAASNGLKLYELSEKDLTGKGDLTEKAPETDDDAGKAEATTAKAADKKHPAAAPEKPAAKPSTGTAAAAKPAKKKK